MQAEELRNSFSSAVSLLARLLSRPLECAISNAFDNKKPEDRNLSTRSFLQTFAVGGVGLLTLLSVATQAAAQGRGAQAFAHVKEVQEKHLQALMERLGVVGSGIGLNQQGEPTIKVFVETPAHAAGLPQVLDGVPVAVTVTGKIVALACPAGSGQWDPTAKCDRPVPIGVSTGHPLVTAGTIGARVKDVSGNVYALSNNHVFANENKAIIGDPVFQPGSYDGGLPADTIGNLHAFEPIKFCTPFSWLWICSVTNTIDAAIAISSPTNWLGNSTPPYGYGTPKSAIFGDNNGDRSFDNISNLLNLSVQKCGRTTGCTSGTITAVNATIDVGYGTGLARFVDQLIVEAPNVVIAGGDSGSLLVGPNAHPVGLLFAGGSGGMMAVANRIDLVLNRFGVTVDGEDAPPPPPNTMHVASISVTRERSSSRWRGVAVVTIVNASGQSVQGVTVTGNFSGPRTDNNQTATTNSSGQATLRSGWQRNPQGKWCFQVTNVSGGGLTYNSPENVESSDCEP